VVESVCGDCVDDVEFEIGKIEDEGVEIGVIGVFDGGGGRGISKISAIFEGPFELYPPPKKIKLFEDVDTRYPRPSLILRVNQILFEISYTSTSLKPVTFGDTPLPHLQ
jgi:hypothetical protein